MINRFLPACLVNLHTTPRRSALPFPVTTVLLSCCLLAGCEGEVTVDLATDPPADRTLQAVSVALEGLEFRRSDGSTEPVRFSVAEPVELLQFLDAQTPPLRLLTNEQLPEGTYDGVRLLFDDSNPNLLFVTEADGTDVPMRVESGEYAAIDVAIQEDESSQDSLVLMLDLRQSLSLDTGADEYTLRSYLRAVNAAEAGQITGSINIGCPAGSSLQQGGAVYLFTGRDQQPDDRDGAGVEPLATTSAVGGLFNTFTYQLRFLPEGDYTIAATCEGDQEDPQANDDLTFTGVRNLRLRRVETLRHDIS